MGESWYFSFDRMKTPKNFKDPWDTFPMIQNKICLYFGQERWTQSISPGHVTLFSPVYPLLVSHPAVTILLPAGPGTHPLSCCAFTVYLLVFLLRILFFKIFAWLLLNCIHVSASWWLSHKGLSSGQNNDIFTHSGLDPTLLISLISWHIT